MSDQPEILDVDFGDEPTSPPRTSTPPRSNGSSQKIHPADEEWVPPIEPPAPPHAYTPRSRRREEEKIGRELPNSLSAEEYFLACCFLDGDDIIPRAEEAKIRPETFYDPKHGIIYGAILKCHREKKLTDVSVVAEELKTSKLLDTVGGYPFLTQVSSRVPTTAQAGYFMDKVRETSLLREVIRSATGIVEDAHNFSGGLNEFLDGVQEKVKEVLEGNAITREEKIAARAFDINRQIPKPDPIFTLAGTTVSTPGNITAIYSQAKTGKSSLIGAMMSAAMTNPTSGHDCLGMAGPNYKKHALLHFDTEQSPYDWQQLLKSSLRRVNLQEPPPWLMSYTLTGLSAAECRDFIRMSLKRARKKFGGIHSIVIDGIADLVIDPNDPAECFPLITELHAAAIEFNTAVVAILHMNPGSEVKGRGHLGSQLERKAESNLTLEKEEGEITRVWATRQRGKTITKEKAQCFKWSDEHQMHRTCATPGTPEAKSRRGTKELKFNFSEFRNSFPGFKEQPKPLAEIHRTVVASVPINMNQFYNVVQRFVRDGMLLEHDVRGQKKTYQLPV